MIFYAETILYLFSAGATLIAEDALLGVLSAFLLVYVCTVGIRRYLAVDSFTAKVLSLPLIFGALYSFSWILIYQIGEDLFLLVPFSPAPKDVYRTFLVSYLFFTFVACGYLATILLFSAKAKELGTSLSFPRISLIRGDSDLLFLLFLTTTLTIAFGAFLTISNVWATVAIGDRGRVWDILSGSRFWIFHVILVTLSYFVLVACFDPRRSQSLRVVGALVISAYILLSLATGSRREILPLLIVLMFLLYRKSKIWFFVLGFLFLFLLLAVGLARLSSSYTDDVPAETTIASLVGELMYSRVPLFAALFDTFSPSISLSSALVSYIPDGGLVFASPLADQFATWAGLGFGFAFSPDAEALVSLKSDLNVIFLPLYLLPFLVLFLLRQEFRPLMFIMLAFSFWRGDLSSSFGIIFLHSIIYYGLLYAMQTKRNLFSGGYEIATLKPP